LIKHSTSPTPLTLSSSYSYNRTHDNDRVLFISSKMALSELIFAVVVIGVANVVFKGRYTVMLSLVKVMMLRYNYAVIVELFNIVIVNV